MKTYKNSKLKEYQITMSEQGQTGWEAPAPKPAQAPEQILAERYADRENPDDMDDMVVLPGDKTPGYIEVPDWRAESTEVAAEQPIANKYEAQVSDLIDVANNRNPMQRKVLMRQFLDGIMKDVEAGAVKSSKGEAYSTEVMTRQLASLFQGLTQPVEGEDPLMFMPKAEGLRATMDALLRNESTAQALMDAVQERLRGPVSPEVRNAQNVALVGGEALDVAGIKSPAEASEATPELSIDDQLALLVEGLSEDDKTSLEIAAQATEGIAESYAAIHAGKQTNDTEAALRDDKQTKARFESQMTDAAKAVKGQYYGLHASKK